MLVFQISCALNHHEHLLDQQEEDLRNHLITSEKDDKAKGDKDITTIIFMEKKVGQSLQTSARVRILTASVYG